MKEIKHHGKIIQVDDQGYLVNMYDWDDELARELAMEEGIEDISEAKLEIVRFMREYYIKFKAFPILNYVCKKVHQHRGCVNEEFINPEKAWRIAGLPKLENVHFVSVDGKHFIMEEAA